MKTDVNIVVCGGGTGTSTLLHKLKDYSSKVTAIVNMADDGGSTGVLRDELSILPPGDVRQCLSALTSSQQYRELLEYRFDSGILNGHSFGNILLAALEKTTGSTVDAVKVASKLLQLEGTVVPATLDDVRLEMSWEEEGVKLIGEHIIDDAEFEHDPRRAVLSLSPPATANPEAITAIQGADLIVFAPGDLYSSLGPILAIDGISREIAEAEAKKVYVCNLTTKHGQTGDFSVSQHATEIERFAGMKLLDAVLCNNEQPDPETLEKYHQKNAFLVDVDTDALAKMHYQTVATKLLGAMKDGGEDTFGVKRSYIRHDADVVAKELLAYYEANL